MSVSGWTLGVLLVVVVALIWTWSSVFTQIVFTQFDFNKPFFVTYLQNSMFLVLLLPLRSITRSLKTLFRRPVAAIDEDNKNDVGHFRSTAWKALIVCPMWFAANCLYTYGLSMTSVTSSTVISVTSTAFTLILSRIVLKESFTIWKVLGVVLCILGNVFTALNDDSGDKSNSTLGDLLSLAGAIMYAAYTVAICYHKPDDMALFFGLLGCFNLVIFALPVVVLHCSGLEPLDNLTWGVFGALVVNGMLNNVLADFIWAKAMLLTSANVATIGLSLTVPLAYVELLLPDNLKIDAPDSTWKAAVGAICVLGGFVVISVQGPEAVESSEQQQLSAELPEESAPAGDPLLVTQPA